MSVLHIMTTAANAVLPIVLLIWFGWWLRRVGFITDEFVTVGNKLVFRFLLPMLLFCNTYKIQSFSQLPWDLVIYCYAMVIALFLAGILFLAPLTPDPRKKGVLLQAIFRGNIALIGVPLASALGGDDAMTVVTVLTAFVVTLLNVLGVVSLAIYSKDGAGDRLNPLKILKGICTNPLIIGIALGFVCLALRRLEERLFGSVVFSLSTNAKFLYSAVNMAGSAATPMALLVMGGQFRFTAVKELRREIVAGTCCRLVITPIIGITAAVLLTKYTGLLHCVSSDYPGLIAVFGTPVSVSSAAMAAQMNGDEQLATQLVVWSSLLSIVTVFLTVVVLMAAGLLVV